MDYLQLYEYNGLVRRSFLEALSKLPWDEVIKNREASFYSIRNIFLHTLEVEERLIHYLISGKVSEWSPLEFDNFTDIDRIRARTYMIDEGTEKILGSLPAEKLTEFLLFPRRDLPAVRMTVEDVLLQNLTEQVHHRGELIALLWQLDVEPPKMGWSFYVNEANKGRMKHRPPTRSSESD